MSETEPPQIDALSQLTMRGKGEVKRWIETWLPKDSDECCVPSTSDPLGDVILATADLEAFWKLNESTGTTAADSSGNGFDLTSTGFTTPTWGSTPIVTPDTSAAFAVQAVTPMRFKRASFANLALDDFTAIIFFKRSGVTYDALIGQGDTVQPGGNGWNLQVEAFNQGAGNRLLVSKGPGTNTLEGAAPSIADTDAHMAAVTFEFATDTWTIYLDGLNVGSEVDPFTGTTGIWIGASSPTNVTEAMDGDLAYGAIFSRVLSAAELTHFFDLFGAAGAIVDGYVLTADSTATAGWSWQPPTIEVQF